MSTPSVPLSEAIARHVLVSYMSDLSEDYYAAGWMSGWENECRRRVTTDEGIVLAELQRLSGGWWPSSYEDVSEYRYAQAVVERYGASAGQIQNSPEEGR